MGDRLQPLRDPARRQREKERESERERSDKIGRNEMEKKTRLTYAFNDRLETNGPRYGSVYRGGSLLAIKRVRTLLSGRLPRQTIWTVGRSGTGEFPVYKRVVRTA